MGSNPLNTVGTIAQRHSARITQVEYIIRARGIEPCGRAGNARVFDDAAVARIASELKRIQAEKDAPKW